MSSMKSVLITLPKGLARSSGIMTDADISRGVSKINSVTTVLHGKAVMEARNTVRANELEEDHSVLFKSEACIRGKKRRLDHLTWEEKLQRKKLKNRVAAQTSRDRKKARLDELEDNVKALKERNEALTRECAMLRKAANLFNVPGPCRLRRILAGIYSIPLKPSAAGWNDGAGIVPDANTKSCDPSQNLDPLPPLEELFADIQGEDYIDRLEELAESLLREVTAEVEGNSAQSNQQVPLKENTLKKCDDSKGMVGQASKNVETNRTRRGLSTTSSWHSVNNSGNIAKNASSTTRKSLSAKTKLNRKQEVVIDDKLDMLYGTYDEATNSITIIYPGDDELRIPIHEPVEEVVIEDVNQADESLYLTPHHSCSDQLSPAYTCVDSMSPSSIHSEDMDAGYSSGKADSCPSDTGCEPESTVNSDSVTTRNNLPLTDLWQESFSELFPALA